MSIHLAMRCWEIIKCNNQKNCYFAETAKKPCWEKVKQYDSSSFHNCVDCLVYLSKHKDPAISTVEFLSILEKRKSSGRKVRSRWCLSQISPVLSADPKGLLFSQHESRS